MLTNLTSITKFSSRHRLKVDAAAAKELPVHVLQGPLPIFVGAKADKSVSSLASIRGEVKADRFRNWLEFVKEV